MLFKAARYASFLHENQKYGNFPYIVHLCDVVKNLRKYHYDDEEMLAAGFLHDTIEDCHVSMEYLSSNFSSKVAELVAAVSGIGKNRKERKIDTLEKLTKYPKAIPLKMADRLANLNNCVEFNPRLLDMYKKEFLDYDSLFEDTNSEMNYAIRQIIKGD